MVRNRLVELREEHAVDVGTKGALNVELIAILAAIQLCLCFDSFVIELLNFSFAELLREALVWVINLFLRRDLMFLKP